MLNQTKQTLIFFYISLTQCIFTLAVLLLVFNKKVFPQEEENVEVVAANQMSEEEQQKTIRKHLT